jgi:hypothetical protein
VAFATDADANKVVAEASGWGRNENRRRRWNAQQ